MFIYSFIVFLLFTLAGPFLFFRFKGLERKQRFGFFEHRFDSSIWVHAASMGEVNAVNSLVKTLMETYPHYDFILTTMTATGQEMAKKISPKLVTSFLPFDSPTIMKRFFKRVKPKLIILVETEIWPHMLYQARKHNIPVIIVNGRISKRSFPRYKYLRFFWKPLWKSVNAVNAQSEVDADRFHKLGFRNIINTQNLKFCMKLPEFERQELRKNLGYKEDEFILVWGSSRPGEEKLLLSILPELNEKIDKLRIVVVPRHLSRLSELREIFRDSDYQFYSEIKNRHQILIVDEMGILNQFYALADVAIVGGSFYNFGGHNPLEPAYYGIPVIMGKFHQDCHDSVRKLQEYNGITISKKKELAQHIIKLYQDKEYRTLLGKNAKETLQKNSDSLQKNLEILKSYF